MNASAPSADFPPTQPDDPTLLARGETVPMLMPDGDSAESGANAGKVLPIQFTGNGSDYFGIWIVNLLLILVTLGLYYPFAKVRRLRYFHSNTQVDGHALDFHANPWKMLRGYILVALLFLVYNGATQFSPLAGLLAFGVIAALWPALLYSSMRFRLSNTSWRGLRFRFTGSVGGAYKAILPLFVPGLVLFASTVLLDDPDKPGPAWVGFFLAVMVATLAVMPWLMWNLKKYQHNHYALGPWGTQLQATVGSFYGVVLKTVGLAMLCSVVVGVFAGLAVGAGMFGFKGGSTGMALAMVAVITVLVMALIVAQIIPVPYFVTRMQNTVWGGTGGAALQFRSDLRFKPFLKLTLLNTLLTVLTLGFYRPWAAVATARMRLEAISVETREDPARLEDELRAASQDASGDAGGDFLGFDIGL